MLLRPGFCFLFNYFKFDFIRTQTFWPYIGAFSRLTLRYFNYQVGLEAQNGYC